MRTGAPPRSSAPARMSTFGRDATWCKGRPVAGGEVGLNEATSRAALPYIEDLSIYWHGLENGEEHEEPKE